MRLRDEYIKFRQERADKPFDQINDEVFMWNYFGVGFPEYCKSIMKELIEMQRELDEIHTHINDKDESDPAI